MKWVTFLVLTIFISCTSPKENNEFHKTKNPCVYCLDEEINFLFRSMKLKNLYCAIKNRDRQEWKTQYCLPGQLDEDSVEKAILNLDNIKSLFIKIVVLQLYEEDKLKLENKQNEGVDNDIYIQRLLSKIQDSSMNQKRDQSIESLEKIINLIEISSGKNIYNIIQKKIIDKLEMKSTYYDFEANKYVTTFYDLNKLFAGINDNRLFKKHNTHKLIYKPLYLKDGEISKEGFFWHFMKYKHLSIYWLSDKYYLCINVPSLNIFSVFLTKDPSMNRIFDLDKGNLLDSPFAVSFIKNILLPEDSLISIDFSNKTEMLTHMEEISSGLYKRLYINWLVALGKIFRYTDDMTMISKIDSLYFELYPTEIPLRYLMQDPLASIDEVGDNFDLQRFFELHDREKLKVFCSGEFEQKTKDNLKKTDNAELFFYIKNNKEGEEKRIFQIFNNYNEVKSTISSIKGVEVASQNNKNSSLVEISLPWSILKTSEEYVDSIKFDIIFNDYDNDGSDQCKISWNSDCSFAYRNPKLYGDLVLKNVYSNQKLPCGSTIAIETNKTPIIDGNIDAVWFSSPVNKGNKLVSGIREDENDACFDFRLLWDLNNLYILLQIEDNYLVSYKKEKKRYNCDYGLIKRVDNNQIVWKLALNEADWLNNNYRHKFVREEINLEPGKYYIQYISDSKYSYYSWEDNIPEFFQYGISLYKISQ